MEEENLGDCFEVAATWVAYASLHDDPKETVLVHGIVAGTGGSIKGIRYCHAWVEVGDHVVDLSCGRDIKLEKDLYYIIGQISPEKVVRYKREEVKDRLFKSEHYGPWELDSRCPCEDLVCEQREDRNDYRTCV